jgi:hypothetical protein
MPSEAYWGGLGTWGVRRRDLSISEYARSFSVFSGGSVDLDDDLNPVVRSHAMWAGLPSPPEGFLQEDIDFKLSDAEAAVLVDHLRGRHPRSLLAVASTFPGDAAQADWPWEVPQDRLGPELREVIRHARCVSELTVGPQHLYNLLLAQRATRDLQWETQPLQDRLAAEIATWTALVHERHEELAEWVRDLTPFWALVGRHDAIPPQTQQFVTTMVQRAVVDPAAFIEDAEVRGLIRDREIHLKGNRARLATRTALENWNGQPFGAQLIYRWPTARSYLADIAAALGNVA